jgi:hypothetical protein
VTDIDAGVPTAPTGTVRLSSVPSDKSPGGGSCTLSGTGHSASCQIVHTPTISRKFRTRTLTATYYGDDVHASSRSSGISQGVGPHATRASLSCGQPMLQVGESTSCTAVVTDISGAPVSPPPDR